MTRAELLRHFPNRGPCLLCMCKTLGSIHRLIDAIRDRYQADESVEDIAKDYTLPIDAVQYVATAPLRELDFLRRNKG